MKTLIVGLATVVVSAFVGILMAPITEDTSGEIVEASAEESIVTVEATPVVPLEHDHVHQNMRFQTGTYGGSYFVDGDQSTWILWAAAGQTLTIAAEDRARVLLSFYGSDYVFEDKKVILPASGNYLLTVAGVDQFTIDIR